MINATITGHLGRDPEQRTFGDQTVTTFSVAANSIRKDKETGAPYTMWINVSMWGKRGEYWLNNLSKGSKVLITGELIQRTYMSNKTNKQETILEMTCDTIENLTPRPAREESDSAAPAANNNLGGFTEVDDEELPF